MELPFLPALVISARSTEEPHQSGLSEALCTWTDADGEPIGRSGRSAGSLWIEIFGVGTYRFNLDSGGVEAIQAREGAREVVNDTYMSSILPHVLQARGIQVLHASAVEVDDGVVAFCGVSGMGKSTLAFGLGRRGLPVRADDALAIACEASICAAYDLPFGPRLTAGAAAKGSAPITVSRRKWQSASTLRALVLLRRVEDSAGTEDRFLWSHTEPSGAFPELLKHAYWLDVGDEMARRQLVETYLEIAARVPIFDCQFVSDLERLEELLDHLEAAIHEL